MQGTELQQFIIARLEDSKAEDMVTIDVRGKSSVTDCMIICTGTSSRHLASVADKLIDECRKMDYNHWVLKVKVFLTGLLLT